MELFKWMDDDNLEHVSEVINNWWENKADATELTKALVVSLYKKGDPKKQENYRPISLLKSIYKIYAGILKKRIEEGIEEDIQKSQFGFRKNKSTTQALYILRRVQDNAESSGEPLVMAFLDWEKAFDRIKHDKIFRALEKLGIDQKLINAIKEIYRNPQFKVVAEQSESTWHQQ